MRSNYRPSLTAREVELLADLERARKSRVTLAELAERFTRPTAYELVRALVAKGALVRVSRGVYLARPVRALGRPWSSSAAVVASHIVAGEPHYLGGWWAWSMHGLTRQMHTSRVDVFARRWRPERKLAGARIVFHQLASAKLDYGIVTVTVENVPVRASDLERSLLDALDHPSLLGPLAATVDRVAGLLMRADSSRLVDYAVRGSRSSTCQRLGVLLERIGVGSGSLRPLARRIRETTSVLSLAPGRARSGRVHPTWRVVENA